MMDNKTKAYGEIYAILNLIEDKTMIEKIPKEILKVFENQRDKNYNPNITKNIPLQEQKLLEETINILAVLKYEYWSTQEDRKTMDKMFEENEKIYQNKLREMYNPDNIFESRIKKNQAKREELLNMVEYKETFYKKIWKYIKELLKRK